MTMTRIQLPRWMRIATAILAIILPVALSAFYIKTFGLNIAYWDEFEVQVMINKLSDGSIGWNDFFSLHNEHLILFPRIISMVLAWLTHWDSRAGMWTSWLFLILTCVLLFQIFRRSLPNPEADLTMALLKFAPIVWVLHSWRQNENLLWGYQFAFFLMIFAVLMALALLNADRRVGAKFWLAVCAGIVAPLSLANGILVWPIGFLVLASQRFIPYDRQAQNGTKTDWLRRAGIWGIIGLVVGILYFYGYSKSQHPPALPIGFWYAKVAVRSLLAFFGFLILHETSYVIAVGLLVILLFCTTAFVRFRVRPSATTIFPCSLILFSLFSSVLIVAGRALGGIEAMAVSRYSSFSAIGLVGAYWLVITNHASARNRFLTFAIATAASLSVLGGYQLGWKQGKTTYALRQTLSFYAVTSPIQSEENLWALLPYKMPFRELLETSRKRGYNVYRETPNLAAAHKVTNNSFFYNIDGVGGKPYTSGQPPIKIPAGEKESLKINGWAIDPQSQTITWGILLELDGKDDFPVTYGLERGDIQIHFANEDCLYSGFKAELPVENLPPGIHSIRLKIYRLGGKEYYQPEQTIQIEVQEQ